MTDNMWSERYAEDLWYAITSVEDVASPALLIYPERIEQNIRKMIAIAGNVELIRPHVKTHKMSGIIRLQMKYGIHKFKCATIAEAEMVAECGADDILLAYQPVGPNIDRFFRLKKGFPDAKISCIADSEEVIFQLSETAGRYGMETYLWLDIDNGMNRTGVLPGKKAVKLFEMIIDSPMLKAEGLHVYDGHIHESDFNLRQKICNDAFAPVTGLAAELEKLTNSSLTIVAGGTPTFPIHAKRNGVETSPGTVILWDYSYSSSFPDLNFLHAAVLMMRIISKPGKELICLDLGHKAIASEMPQPRIKILGLNNYIIINHNEEHMVIRTPEARDMKIGNVLYGIPYHICPTVDRYDTVTVVKDGKAEEQWDVEARKRRITY
jgi:D-serine deaminase-like pyridoxal phosphate-dependent protein